MATSSVPRVKAALVDGLAAALAPVKVFYGHPGNFAERECVFVGSTLEADQDFASLGAMRRDETYSLELFVVVSPPSSESFRTVTERAFAVFGQVEDWLRDRTNLTADGNATYTHIATPDFVELFVNENSTQRRTVITSAISVRARI